MIQYATLDMKLELLELWQQAFGDKIEYIVQFFDSFDISKTVIVYCNETGKPISMLALLPAYYIVEHQKKEAFYIYGVATQKEERGRGYSGKLLEYVKGYLREKKAIGFLSPATDSLISFYQRQGFYRLQKRETINLWKGEVEELYFEEIQMEEYASLRKQLSSTKYIQWEPSVLKYAIKENNYCNGNIVKCRIEGKDIAVLYRIRGVELEILEITTSNEEIMLKIASALFGINGIIERVVIAQKIEVMATDIEEIEELQFHLAMG